MNNTVPQTKWITRFASGTPSHSIFGEKLVPTAKKKSDANKTAEINLDMESSWIAKISIDERGINYKLALTKIKKVVVLMFCIILVAILELPMNDTTKKAYLLPAEVQLQVDSLQIALGAHDGGDVLGRALTLLKLAVEQADSSMHIVLLNTDTNEFNRVCLL